MTLWNVELFSVTDALVTLKSNSRKIKIREIILKGRSEKIFSGKKFVYLGTVNLSPEHHIGNIFT